jgi:alpha-L-fucosidase
MIITAKHHDGFAMYDSDVSDYDVVQATPWKRDPMRLLRDAARRHGVRFGFYYSHAFDWGDAEAPGNDWEYDNPGGDRNLYGGREWWVASPERVAKARRYVDRKAIPQIRELIRKYDPDILWFDTPHKLPPAENLRILRAAREAKPTLVINSRIVQPVPGGPPMGFGDYLNTADRPAELTHPAGDWEAIPTTNESYGWHRADSTHKPPEHFVRLLAKAAARGGNLLLNVGPMGDGRLDPRDTLILAGVGRWMAANGASVRGTARTPLPPQAWGESTRKGNRLYLHVLDWPRGGRLRVAGLRSDVVRATLLARPGTSLAVRRVGPSDVEIAVPAEAPDPWDAVIALDVAAPISVDSARRVARDEQTRLHVFDGELVGQGVTYSDGKRNNDVAIGWSRANGGVEWPVRVEERGRYRVSLDYGKAAADTTGGGSFEVVVGEARLAVRPEPTGGGSRFEVREVGSLPLERGTYTLRIRSAADGASSLRLRRVILTPTSE